MEDTGMGRQSDGGGGPPPDAGPEKDAHLSELEQVMRQVDFVLEPADKTLKTLQEYRKAGGKPADAITMLSENFVGYAHMASLMCRWLALATEDQDSSEAAQSSPTDEFYFLSEFVKQQFDPAMFVGVFQRGGAKGIQWLDELLLDPRGRQLIYALSAQHRNSLLLNYAIQKVMQLGHQDEVAGVGSSLASYFSVYHKLLTNRLMAVIEVTRTQQQQQESAASQSAYSAPPNGTAGSKPNQPSLATLSKEVTETCGRSHHTYLHAQQLLTCLASQPGGEVFQRLSQDLEAAAAREHSAVWTMQHLLLPQRSAPNATEAARLVGAICLKGSLTVAAPLLELHGLYTSSDPPPLSIIQHSQLLQILVSSIFNPTRPLGGNVLSSALDLLATATTSREHADEGTAHRHGDTVAALQSTLDILAHAKLKWTDTDTERAQEVAALPVASLGALHTIRTRISQQDYYEEAASAVAVPCFVKLALLIARQQPDLVPLVIEALHGGLKAVGSQRTELVKMYLDACVVLMRDCHAVMEVMAMIRTWARTDVDPSLVRTFVMQVLSNFGPPFSPQFAYQLLQLMISSGIRRGGREMQRGSRNLAIIEEFGRACMLLKFQPSLSEAEAQFVHDLVAQRY